MEIYEIALIAPVVIVILGLIYSKFILRKTLDQNKLILIIGSSSAISFIFAQKFNLDIPVSPSEGVGYYLIFLVLHNLIQIKNIWASRVSLFFLVAVLSYFTFPWTNHGVSGWIKYVITVMMVCIFSLSMSNLSRLKPAVNNWFIVLPTFVTVLMVLAGHGNTSSVEVAIAMILPIAIVRIVYFKDRETNFTFSYVNIFLSLLILRVTVRYAPDDIDGILEKALINSSVLVWLFAPMGYVLLKKISPLSKVSLWVFIGLQIVGSIIALTVYKMDFSPQLSQPSYDYNSL